MSLLIRPHLSHLFDNSLPQSLPQGFPPTPPPDDVVDYFLHTHEFPAITSAVDSAPPEPVVAVIGCGYVGAHLVEAFAQVLEVIAFDVSETRLQDLTQQLEGLPVCCTSQPQDLREADYFLISVPTILKHDKTIDTTYLQSAVATVRQQAKVGATVVVESSVAVGMTRELLGPLVSLNGLKVGMSPERVDPGRKLSAFEDIPKVISGLDQASLDSISSLYGRIFRRLVPVSSPEVAEMTKLYENCQRMVCAAYANEMADACIGLNIDPWEVSQAAESKPFGYQPFKPGPGIGGHCIPVNPYYLLATCDMPILKHAAENSSQRPTTVANRIMTSVEKTTQHDAICRTKICRPRVLVVGVGFKRGQSVMSNSPGVGIAVALMSDWDVYVEFADPLVSQDSLSFVPKMNTQDNWTPEYLGQFDGIVVAVDQPGLDIKVLNDLSRVIVHDYCPSAPNQFQTQIASK